MEEDLLKSSIAMMEAWKTYKRAVLELLKKCNEAINENIADPACREALYNARKKFCETVMSAHNTWHEDSAVLEWKESEKSLHRTHADETYEKTIIEAFRIYNNEISKAKKAKNNTT